MAKGNSGDSSTAGQSKKKETLDNSTKRKIEALDAEIKKTVAKAKKSYNNDGNFAAIEAAQKDAARLAEQRERLTEKVQPAARIKRQAEERIADENVRRFDDSISTNPDGTSRTYSQKTDGAENFGESFYYDYNKALRTEWYEKIQKGKNTSGMPFAAMLNYTGSAYIAMNKQLRTGQKLGQTKNIKGLDKAIDDAPAVPKNMVVYRKFTLPSLYDSMVKNGGTLTGHTIQDKGFQSTSVRDDAWDGKFTMKILLPKGSKGYFVGKYSSSDAGEAEMILPRNTKYKVIKTENKKDSNGEKYTRLVVRAYTPNHPSYASI